MQRKHPSCSTLTRPMPFSFKFSLRGRRLCVALPLYRDAAKASRAISLPQSGGCLYTLSRSGLSVLGSALKKHRESCKLFRASMKLHVRCMCMCGVSQSNPPRWSMGWAPRSMPCTVQDRKCQGPGCTRMPNFNFPGEKGGIFCAQHKAEGMVDIKHKRCVEPGCNKRPSFNYTGKRIPHMWPGHRTRSGHCHPCMESSTAHPGCKLQCSSYLEQDCPRSLCK